MDVLPFVTYSGGLALAAHRDGLDVSTATIRVDCVLWCSSPIHQKAVSSSFLYQEVSIRAQRGDVLVFPACPLHPNRVAMVKSVEFIYAVNYIM